MARMTWRRPANGRRAASRMPGVGSSPYICPPMRYGFLHLDALEEALVRPGRPEISDTSGWHASAIIAGRLGPNADERSAAALFGTRVRLATACAPRRSQWSVTLLSRSCIRRRRHCQDILWAGETQWISRNTSLLLCSTRRIGARKELHASRTVDKACSTSIVPPTRLPSSWPRRRAASFTSYRWPSCECRRSNNNFRWVIAFPQRNVPRQMRGKATSRIFYCMHISCF